MKVMIHRICVSVAVILMTKSCDMKIYFLKPLLSEVDYAKEMQWMYQTSTIWRLRLSPTQGHNQVIHVLPAWLVKTVLLNANFLFCVTPVLVSYECSQRVINMHVTVFHYNMDGYTGPGNFPDWTKITTSACGMVQKNSTMMSGDWV